MKRRDFTKSLLAAGLAPALPLPSLAKAAPVAEIAKDSMYIWADFITRVHNKCSPNMLSRLLKVDADKAAQLYARLMADGVIGAPDVFGISKATKPMFTQYTTVAGHSPEPEITLDKQGSSEASKTVKPTEAPSKSAINLDETVSEEPDLESEDPDEISNEIEDETANRPSDGDEQFTTS